MYFLGGCLSCFLLAHLCTAAKFRSYTKRTVAPFHQGKAPNSVTRNKLYPMKYVTLWDMESWHYTNSSIDPYFKQLYFVFRFLIVSIPSPNSPVTLLSSLHHFPPNFELSFSLFLLLSPSCSIYVSYLFLGVGPALVCGQPTRGPLSKENGPAHSKPLSNDNNSWWLVEFVLPFLSPCRDFVWLELIQSCARCHKQPLYLSIYVTNRFCFKMLH